MYNKKALSKATAELDKAKAPAKPKDIITDPMGQWKYPGLPTRIPGNDITMQGVGYPVLGVANNGQRKIMLPGADYTFPGADYVDEYPQMKKGGTKKRKTKSLSGTNKLLEVNELFKNYKNRRFDPKAKNFQDGGFSLGMDALPEMGNTVEPSLNYDKNDFSVSASTNIPVENWRDYSKNLNLSARYAKDLGKYGNIGLSGNASFNEGQQPDYNMSVNYNKQFKNGLGISIKGDSPLKNIRNNGNANVGLTYNFQKGGPQNTSGPRNNIIHDEEFDVDAMNAMMKARMATDAAFGNPAAQRMTSPNPKTYDFGNGNLGTHFMASMGNQAVPLLQDKGGDELEYNENPLPSKEDMNFRTPEEAQYFAEHYKEVAPMMKGFKEGDYIEAELTEDEIDQYRKGGYIVEDISVPELNQAKKGKSVNSKKSPNFSVYTAKNEKDYAFRKKAYDDSLSMYNLSKLADLAYTKAVNPNISENEMAKFSRKGSDYMEKMKKIKANSPAKFGYVFDDQRRPTQMIAPPLENNTGEIIHPPAPKPGAKKIPSVKVDIKDTVTQIQQPIATKKSVVKQNTMPEGYQPYSLYGKVLDPEVYGYAESLNGKPVQVAQFADTYGHKAKMDTYKKSGEYPWKKQKGGMVTELTPKEIQEYINQGYIVEEH